MKNEKKKEKGKAEGKSVKQLPDWSQSVLFHWLLQRKTEEGPISTGKQSA